MCVPNLVGAVGQRNPLADCEVRTTSERQEINVSPLGSPACLLCRDRYSTFKAKTAVVVGASPGALGGMRAINVRIAWHSFVSFDRGGGVS